MFVTQVETDYSIKESHRDITTHRQPIKLCFQHITVHTNNSHLKHIKSKSISQFNTNTYN